MVVTHKVSLYLINRLSYTDINHFVNSHIKLIDMRLWNPFTMKQPTENKSDLIFSGLIEIRSFTIC